MSPCLFHPGIRAWHGAEAVELGFSLLLLMLTFQRITFMLHSQNESLLQCGQMTVLHQVLGAVSHQKPAPSALLLPPLAALFHSQATVREEPLACRLGQLIPSSLDKALGSGCLGSPALPLGPHPGGFVFCSLCLANHVSGLLGVSLGSLPGLLTTSLLPFRCC